ncbi:hypothetical protein [Dactylosporangium salmoneum]|uniref:LppX_LprAFG lipoprotein n=1 Tax=Dactylosporangium salmoneum TaxID=53361 RepID=A0ABN3GRM7_9ACTN
MTDYDSQLAVGLRALVDDVPIPAAPTETVLRRGRRARHRRKLTVAASGTALALAVGSLSVAAMTGAKDGTPKPPAATGAVADPQTPRLRLAAAIDATAGGSFTQDITVNVENFDKLSAQQRKMASHLDRLRLSGPFDPKARTGYLRSTQADGTSIEQRLINGTLFIGDGKAWKKVPGEHTGFDVASLSIDRIALSADPTQFLSALRELGQVELAASAGADTITYRFTGQLGALPEAGPTYELTGEVTVARAGNLITKVTYRVPAWLTNGHPDVVALVTINLSKHGEPVSVERPRNTID